MRLECSLITMSLLGGASAQGNLFSTFFGDSGFLRQTQRALKASEDVVTGNLDEDCECILTLEYIPATSTEPQQYVSEFADTCNTGGAEYDSFVGIYPCDVPTNDLGEPLDEPKLWLYTCYSLGGPNKDTCQQLDGQAPVLEGTLNFVDDALPDYTNTVEHNFGQIDVTGCNKPIWNNYDPGTGDSQVSPPPHPLVCTENSGKGGKGGKGGSKGGSKGGKGDGKGGKGGKGDGKGGKGDGKGDGKGGKGDGKGDGKGGKGDGKGDGKGGKGDGKGEGKGGKGDSKGGKSKGGKGGKGDQPGPTPTDKPTPGGKSGKGEGKSKGDDPGKGEGKSKGVGSGKGEGKSKGDGPGKGEGKSKGYSPGKGGDMSYDYSKGKSKGGSGMPGKGVGKSKGMEGKGVGKSKGEGKSKGSPGKPTPSTSPTRKPTPTTPVRV